MDAHVLLDPDSSPFYVAGLLVEPNRNRITTPDATLDIERQVMVLLVYLAQRAGEVVPRVELLDTLWPGAPTNDEALTQAISKLRRALGDRGRKRQVIETIRKVGYRLAAPVEAVPHGSFGNRAEVESTPVMAIVPPPIRRVRLAGQRGAWIAIAVAGMLSVANAAMLFNRDSGETSRVFMIRAAEAATGPGDLAWHAIGEWSRDSVAARTSGLKADSLHAVRLLDQLAASLNADGADKMVPRDVTVRIRHMPLSTEATR